MKILYIAKHNNGMNDEEGAIRFALEKLGHEVLPVLERYGRTATSVKADLLLFHHWYDLEAIRAFKSIKKAVWYFDLVEYPKDPSLNTRLALRASWAIAIQELVDFAFFTDGDWVANHSAPNVHWLPQAADERYITSLDEARKEEARILFTGSYKVGASRESFVNTLRLRFPDQFVVIEKGWHKEKLRELIQSSRIVVAPDSPITNRYWSNRVYLTLGFGGFLLHPYCARLNSYQYESGSEFIHYNNLEELIKQIEFFWDKKDYREPIQKRAITRTLSEHTYTHRCIKLLEIVEGKK